jgi:hypothetical protein
MRRDKDVFVRERINYEMQAVSTAELDGSATHVYDVDGRWDRRAALSCLNIVRRASRRDNLTRYRRRRDERRR